jgi:hypothetical protein
MVGFQPVQLRPLAPVVPSFQAPAQHAQMGAIGSMGVSDWLFMGGGAIVAGVGLNSIYAGITSRKPDFVGVTLGAVLAAVGVGLVGSEVRKLAS